MSETVPTSTIQELFDADPNSLSNQDLDRIIESLRAGRAAFRNPAPTEAKAKKPKAPVVESAATKQLSLDDLGL